MSAATPKPRTPVLAVQHAARMLRLGNVIRITSGTKALDGVAAEAVTTEGHAGRLAHLPPGTELLLTGQRLLSLGIPADPEAAYGIPLREKGAPSLIAALADPTAPGSPRRRMEAAARPAPVQAAAIIELAKLSGLLPAALVAPFGSALADASEVVSVELEHIMEYRRLTSLSMRPVSEARVPLMDAENARIVSFRPADGGPEQFAILIGEPEKEAAPLCRLHSECFTGDFLGSLRCDCGDQLRGAIRRMAHEGAGVLLYLAQEGRGIGLTNKLRAYMLQDAGLDTVEANHHLGFGSDERDYWAAAAMLRQLSLNRVRLLTNNPAKIIQLQQYGIEVTGRVPHIFEANAHNRGYLLTKALKSGHMLTVDELQPTSGGDGARFSVV